jgi:branched-chain amino acid aminotransferase
MQDMSHLRETQTNPIWFNDGLVPFADAKLHVITHALNYGTAVFEGIRFYESEAGARIFHMDAHLDRLLASAGKMGIPVRWSKQDIKHACMETVRASGLHSGYIRPQIQFGLSTPGLGATTVVEMTVFAWPLGAYRESETLKVMLSPFERLSPKTGDIEAKVVGFYTNSHFNYAHAHQHGADDAIMLDVNGNVAEASSSNVFIVRNGELLTPKTGFILKGITRATVMELARNELGLTVKEAVLGPDDLRNCDEMFLTGTAAEIDPVSEFNGVTLGDGGIGPITAQIDKLYSSVTRGGAAYKEDWYDTVPLRS